MITLGRTDHGEHHRPAGTDDLDGRARGGATRTGTATVATRMQPGG